MQQHRKKIILWFTALVLIMACMPAAVEPAPTIDPNAINTFIVQTAAVASTLTASLPTLTATATLQDTSTPEPTFTLVAPIIFPTTTKIIRTGYFRVKHDNQLAIYDYKSRTAANNWPVDRWGYQTPEVLPMLVGLNLALGTNRTNMDGNWSIYIDALNFHNKKKINYVKSSGTALFNGAGFPSMESITMGGNLITLDEIQGNWGRVHTINYTNPGALKDVNYITNPDLIHKFVVVGWNRTSKTTFWVNTPQGDLYWPLVSSRAVWIPMEYLEPFPSLPMTVIATATQDIHTGPSTSSPLTGSKLSEGDSVSVIEYHPSASNVWGKLSDGTWIALLLAKNGMQYLTSWKMETQPPSPPSE